MSLLRCFPVFSLPELPSLFLRVVLFFSPLSSMGGMGLPDLERRRPADHFDAYPYMFSPLYPLGYIPRFLYVPSLRLVMADILDVASLDVVEGTPDVILPRPLTLTRLVCSTLSVSWRMVLRMCLAPKQNVQTPSLCRRFAFSLAFAHIFFPSNLDKRQIHMKFYATVGLSSFSCPLFPVYLPYVFMIFFTQYHPPPMYYAPICAKM